MRIKVLTFIFLLFSITLFSQQQKKPTGILEGKVIDESGEPLIGANIRIENTLLGSATTRLGTFRIVKVPIGEVKVRVSMVGYKAQVIPVVIKENQITKIEVRLKQSPIETSEIFVSASRYEQKIQEIPVSVSVINSKDLNIRNSKRLDEALRYVSGVSMTNAQISIRGSSGYTRGAGSRVLLLFDGIPLNTGDTGDIIWQIIPLYEIERVEIVKTAGSALYGSQALGGVINVISKEFSSTPLTYIKTMGGFYDKPFYKEWNWSDKPRFFNQLTLEHSRKIGDVGLSFSLSRFEDDSYKMNSFTKRYSFFLKSKVNLNSTNNLTFLFNGVTYKSGNFLFWKDSRNALVPPEEQIGQTVETVRYNTNLIYKNISSSKMLFSFKSSLYYNNWWDKTEARNSSKSYLLRSEVQVDYLQKENHRFVSGLEVNFAQVNSNIFSNPKAYGLAIYGHDEIKLFSSSRIGFGLRVDYQNIDTVLSELNINPKFNLVTSVTDQFLIRASIGRGYRAPTPSEIFSTTYVSGLKVAPNPMLKSESNWSFELGMNYTFSKYLKTDLAIFNNEFYKFIEPQLDSTSQEIKFQNITRARITGFESNIQFELIKNLLGGHLGYTYLWARDLKEKRFLKYRPRHLLNLNLYYKYNFLQLGMDFRYWNKFESIDEELKLFVKDYDLRDKVLLTDLNVYFDLIYFRLPLKVYFSVNNVFNYNYVEMVGNLGSIRYYTISIEGIF